MERYSFDIKHTNVAKGFFVLVMVFHHVFASQMGYWISLFSGESTESLTLLTKISAYGKVCVGGFCFLSAYGITKKMMGSGNTFRDGVNLIISRLIKLYFGFWPIYLIGIAGTLIFGNTSLADTYISYTTGKFSWPLPLIDMLGLAKIFGTATLNASWWYISIAVCIILFAPICYCLYGKFKFVFVAIVCVFPYIPGVPAMFIYGTIAMLGMLFAKEDLLVKIKNIACHNMVTRIASYIFIGSIIFLTYILTDVVSVIYILPFSTVASMLLCYLILADIPLLRSVFGFVGKHSANIYYVHSFLFLYWFTYTIYRLENKILIYGVVFAGALIISIILELCKKLIGYNKLERHLISKLVRSRK